MMKQRQKWNVMLLWAALCLAVAAAGMLMPVKKACSLGLEGANQANLRSATEELSKGKRLEFVVDAPDGAAWQIGFFFTTNGHAFEEGTLTLRVLDGEETVSRKDFLLKDLTEDQFLFVPLPYEDSRQTPDTLTVQIYSDAVSEAPSIWLNDTAKTPGSAFVNGEPLSKSLVYNLNYTRMARQYQKPFFHGLLLLLFGLGVYGAGGFEKRGKRKPDRHAPVFVMPTGKEAAALLGIVAVTALLFFYLYDTRIRIAQNTTEKAEVLKWDGETVPVQEGNSVFCQTVKPGQDRLTGLGVRFYLEDGVRLTEGTMHAFVTDRTLGQVLCKTDIAASQFVSGEYAGFLFRDSQSGVKDHEYQIDLTFSPELWDSGLELMTSEEGLCVNAYLYFNIFLKKFFFFLFLGVEAFLCVFWHLALVKRARLEEVFLVTVLFFGLVYNVMLTPQMVPDEGKHIDMAYRYSNQLLGYDALGDGKCLMRRDDAETAFTSSPSFANYRNVYYGLFSSVQDGSMVEAQVSSNIEGSLLLYAPAVAGMTFARLMGFGTAPMLLLARYLNLIVFALLTYFGMKRLPFGKMTLFILALLPVNMQQCASFSHDAMAHGVLFFYGCLCLHAIYSGERMNGQRMLEMELAALFLAYCKGGSYLPLCFLPFLIPSGCYENKKKKMLSTFALVGIPILAFLLKHMRMVTGIVRTTDATSVVSAGDGTEYLAGYTIGYFLKEPLEFVYMMVNTVFDKTGFYLESLIGYKLGWVEIETSMALVLFFWLLIFLSLCDRQEDMSPIRPIERLWMAFFCMGCAGLILLGMLFQWTPIGHISIEGVQGRYFLPFLPILLAACRNRMVLLRARIDRGLMAAVVTGQILTLAYMIKYVTMV